MVKSLTLLLLVWLASFLNHFIFSIYYVSVVSVTRALLTIVRYHCESNFCCNSYGATA